MSAVSYRGRAWWASRPVPPIALQLLTLQLLRKPDPKSLPDDNESVRAIRALETITLGHVPLKETA